MLSTKNYDAPNIEEYIEYHMQNYFLWKSVLYINRIDEVTICGKSFHSQEIYNFTTKEYENIYLDIKKDKARTKSLFPYNNFLLHFHRCIKKKRSIFL
jgi:hypothetical protein